MSSPSDEILSEAFSVDNDIQMEEMVEQVEKLGRLAPVQGSTVQTRSARGGTRPPAPSMTSPSPASMMPPTSRPTKRTSNRGRPPKKGQNTPTPRRENQMAKLAQATASIQDDEHTPIPDDDAMASKDYEEMSARSSHIEDTMSLLEMRISVSETRVATLEKENSLLVGKINGLAEEFAKIKETHPHTSSLTAQRNTGRLLDRAPTAVSSAGSHDGASAVSEDQQGWKTGEKRAAPPSSPVGGRPVPKKKVIG